jgi:hypothetical protein
MDESLPNVHFLMSLAALMVWKWMSTFSVLLFRGVPGAHLLKYLTGSQILG